MRVTRRLSIFINKRKDAGLEAFRHMIGLSQGLSGKHWRQSVVRGFFEKFEPAREMGEFNRQIHMMDEGRALIVFGPEQGVRPKIRNHPKMNLPIHDLGIENRSKQFILPRFAIELFDASEAQASPSLS